MKPEYSKMSDEDLYCLLQSDIKTKERAFAELYTRYSKRVYMYCRRIIGNEDLANDVFQDTFLNFLESAKKDRVMTNVPGFLLKIARNQCLNLNRSKKHIFISIDDLEIGIENMSLEQSEISELIVASLDLLNDEQRESIVLQVYNDMSYAEIGEFFGVPVSTVRNWIVRGKQKMREILAPYLEYNSINKLQKN